MPAYTQIEFNNISPEQSSLLIALLSDSGIEGFEEGENSLKAYTPASAFDEEAVKQTAGLAGLSFTTSLIADTNWNQVWESNFEPVRVNNFVAIRADFHPPATGVLHEIIITPKMSFGTGHHATTYMMMQEMQSIEFTGKQVFDFGTGTGVLAILAEKLGADKVIAIDIDDWSVENAAENIRRNNASRIEVIQRDSPEMNQQFGHILANINKHIILANLETLYRQLKPGGALLLSGLLLQDEADILAAAKGLGLSLVTKAEKHNWLCLKLSY